jgi:hypothetical protein
MAADDKGPVREDNQPTLIGCDSAVVANKLNPVASASCVIRPKRCFAMCLSPVNIFYGLSFRHELLVR